MDWNIGGLDNEILIAAKAKSSLNEAITVLSGISLPEDFEGFGGEISLLESAIGDLSEFKNGCNGLVDNLDQIEDRNKKIVKEVLKKINNIDMFGLGKEKNKNKKINQYNRMMINKYTSNDNSVNITQDRVLKRSNDKNDYDIFNLSLKNNGKKITIPGLNQGYIPQGYCLMNDNKHDWAIFTSYYPNKKGDSEKIDSILTIVDRETGKMVKGIRLDGNDTHVGGVSVIGNNVYVCNSDKRYVYSLDDVKAVNNGGSIKPRKIVDTNIGGSFSGTSSNGKYYITGDFDNQDYQCKREVTRNDAVTIVNRRVELLQQGQNYSKTNVSVDSNEKKFNNETKSVPLMAVYGVNDDKNISNETQKIYELPEEVQGAAMDEDGRIWIIRSYGRKNVSKLECYDNSYKTNYNYDGQQVYSLGEPMVDIEVPALAENITIEGDEISFICESGASKYREDAIDVSSEVYCLDINKLIDGDK